MSLKRQKQPPKSSPGRQRIDLHLGKKKRDRYLAQWYDDMIADGRNPSAVMKMIVYEALTKISSLTGKPIAVDLIEERDRSADDEDVHNSLFNIDT